MSNFTSAVKAFMDDENGVTAIEYGLIAALIGVTIVTASGNVKTALQNAFNYVAGQINSAVGGGASGG
ncbi:MAG TPA: Flp family type IVb pilin [Telluria sp.]|jgi:pilus assembly protein Flp/PilA